MEEEKQQPQQENEPVIGEFKGNPVITLNPNSRYPFTFGLSKAKLILEHLDRIKEFIAQFDKKNKPS
jgi:hypothetical protein